MRAFLNWFNRVGFVGLASLVAVGCAARPLSQPEAQRAVDEWLQKHVELLVQVEPEASQRAIDAEIRRLESFGVAVTDDMLAQMKKEFAAPHVAVVGVQEIPAQNAAVADLDMKSFYWRANGSYFTTKLPGKATFAHYSDGRWVLTTIQWEAGAFQVSPNIRAR